jgi:transposase
VELFGGEVVAIDGSKFKAVTNRTRNFTPKKLARALAEIDAKSETYLAELDQHDAAQAAAPESMGGLQAKIAHLQERRHQYAVYQQELAASGATQLSLTDPDCRARPVSQGTDVGYYDGEEVKACLDAGITPYVAKPHTSRNQQAGLLTKADFEYDAEQDTYPCPAGATMTYRFTADEAGRLTRSYATPACGACPLRTQCTRSRTEGRRSTRWEHEGLLDEMAKRVQARPDLMKQRKQIGEHPCGTMKRAMNHGSCLMRGLPKVRAEMRLTVVAYNLKRVLNILGGENLLNVVMPRCGYQRCAHALGAHQQEKTPRLRVRGTGSRVFTRSGALLGGIVLDRTRSFQADRALSLRVTRDQSNDGQRRHTAGTHRRT